MTWVRIDDEFYAHPKVATLRADVMLACIGLHTLALCWCNHKLTDGLIPYNQVHRLAGDLSLALPSGNPHALINELVRVGMWEPAKNEAYRIHDYFDYQPSRAQIEALKAARSQAGKRGADARWRDKEPARPGPSMAPAIAPPIAPAMAPPMAESCPVPVPVPVDHSVGAPTSGATPVDNSAGTGDFRGIDFDKDEPSQGPPSYTEAQKLVALYVEAHTRLGRSKPTQRQIGIVAQVIGEKLRGGAKIEHMTEAVERLVVKGKPPSVLPAIIAEVEAEGADRARSEPRNTFPPPEPPMTPEERAASLLVAEEGRKKLTALTAGVGREMP